MRPLGFDCASSSNDCHTAVMTCRRERGYTHSVGYALLFSQTVQMNFTRRGVEMEKRCEGNSCCGSCTAASSRGLAKEQIKSFYSEGAAAGLAFSPEGVHLRSAAGGGRAPWCGGGRRHRPWSREVIGQRMR